MQTSTSFTTVLITVLSLAVFSTARDGPDHGDGTYILTDNLSQANFFSAFEFYVGADPTQGFVQYQNLTSAFKQNLASYQEDTGTVFMGVDSSTKSPKGRASVRLESTKTWNQGLLIADIGHMPASICGSWPAFWLIGKEQWPVGGEIDLLEGVNDDDTNAVTLHTSKGCKVDNATSPASGQTDDFDAPFMGHLVTDDCDVAAADQIKNVGCGIRAPQSLSSPQLATSFSPRNADLPSYGTPFNRAGGGIYAMEWTPKFISVWFFPHNSRLYKHVFDTSVPDTSTWGTPLAHFSGAGCDFSQRFKDMRIIFDTTFCGDWAGKEWDKSCAKKTGVSTCEEYVRDNPEAFNEVYWEIRGLAWFQKQAVGKKGGGKGKPRGRFYRG